MKIGEVFPVCDVGLGYWNQGFVPLDLFIQLHKYSLQNQLSIPAPAIFREKVLFWIQLVKGNEENFPRNSGKRESSSARNWPQVTPGEVQMGYQEFVLPRKAWKSLEWAAQGVIIHGNIPKVMWVWHLRIGWTLIPKVFPNLINFRILLETCPLLIFLGIQTISALPNIPKIPQNSWNVIFRPLCSQMFSIGVVVVTGAWKKVKSQLADGDYWKYFNYFKFPESSDMPERS